MTLGDYGALGLWSAPDFWLAPGHWSQCDHVGCMSLLDFQRLDTGSTKRLCCIVNQLCGYITIGSIVDLISSFQHVSYTLRVSHE